MHLKVSSKDSTKYELAGFHLGFSSRGANVIIAELRRGEDYSNTSNAFSSARSIIELIDFLKLGVLGYATPGKLLIFQSLRLFLVASETKFSGLGRSLLPVHCCSVN